MSFKKQNLILFLIALPTSFFCLLLTSNILKQEGDLVQKIESKKPQIEKKTLVTNLNEENKIIALNPQPIKSPVLPQPSPAPIAQIPIPEETKNPTPKTTLIKKKPIIKKNIPKKDIFSQSYIHQDQFIPFSTSTVYDNNIAKGTTIIHQNGVNGIKRIYYTIYYKNGKEIKRIISNSTIIKNPINKIIKIGTKEIFDGRYDYAQGRAILTYTNNERAKIGLPPLKWNYNLAAYANVRSREVSIRPDHIRPNGLKYNSLNPSIIHGENLISGSDRPLTAQAAVNMWMNSPGHKANILRPQFKSMGGSYYINNGKYKHHWIQLFSVY